MSVTSSFLRGVYGTPPKKTATKYRWYRQQQAQRSAVIRRAEAILDREVQRKEQRRSGYSRLAEVTEEIESK